MASTVLDIDRRPRLSISRLILPTEHGSWSFLLEPLVVGTAVAASPAVLWIALMVIAGFFARQPLKMAWLSRNNAGVSATARLLLLAFLAVAGVGVAGTLWTAGPYSLLPLGAAAPLAAVQVYLDLATRGRSLWAELLGSVAISSSAAVLGLAAGFSWQSSAALWIIFACRFVPSVIYVRNRLFLEKGKPFDRVVPVAAHAAALVVLIALAAAGLASALTAAVFAFLLLRSVHGLSERRFRLKAMQIGIWEVIYGALTVISIIVGHDAGI